MNARDRVIERLAGLAGRYPDLRAQPAGEGVDDRLSPRDAALAAAIEQAVLRHWRALVLILQHHLSRPWREIEFPLQAALLAGSAQLLLLDKIPDHAAINETVEWAKKNIRAKAGGLVNAVLRRVMENRAGTVDAFDRDDRGALPLPDGRALLLRDVRFSEDPLARLAEQTSIPVFLLEGWRDRHGWPIASRLALHSLVKAPILVTGVDRDRAAERAEELTPHEREGFYILSGDHGNLLDLLRENPQARVQDPATALAVEATAGLAPRRVVDYCAGRGTKTRQLAALHPGAEVIATDMNTERREALQAQFSRHPSITAVDPKDLARFAGTIDLLVLDVPCSNTGVLARRLEARHRLSPKSIRDLVQLQKQIIADSLALLAPGGRVLYCTCSIEPMENEQVVEWINKWHGFYATRSQATLPESIPGDDRRGYHDGGFFSILER